MATRFTEPIWYEEWNVAPDDQGNVQVYEIDGDADQFLLQKRNVHSATYRPILIGGTADIDKALQDIHVGLSARWREFRQWQPPAPPGPRWYLVYETLTGGDEVYSFVKCTPARAEALEEAGASIARIVESIDIKMLNDLLDNTTTELPAGPPHPEDPNQ